METVILEISAAYARAEYLPWQEEASSVRTDSDAAVSGHF